jgi:hypothetical protein
MAGIFITSTGIRTIATIGLLQHPTSRSTVIVTATNTSARNENDLLDGTTVKNHDLFLDSKAVTGGVANRDRNNVES